MALAHTEVLGHAAAPGTFCACCGDLGCPPPGTDPPSQET